MAAMQVPAGLAIDRLGKRITLIVGVVAVSFAAVLVSLSTNFLQLSVCLAFLGLAGTLYHPAGFAIVSETFQKSRSGRALGVQSGGGDFGILLAFLTSGYLATFFGWRFPFIVWAALGLFVLLLSLKAVNEPISSENVIASDCPANVANRFSIKVIFSEIVILALAAACYRCLFTFLPTYFVKVRGFGVSEAAVFSSVAVAAGVLGGLIGGALSDRFGRKRTISCLMLAIGGFAVALVVGATFLLIPILIGLGFAAFAIFPPLYALISESTPYNVRGFSFSLAMTFMWVSGALAGIAAGSLADLFEVRVIFYLVGVFALIGATLAAKGR
jgi:MFS family permease